MSEIYTVEKKKSNGLAVAALVCGIVALCCCNPLYLVSVAAIVLGIVALATKCPSKAMSIVGLCLGAGAILWGIIWDIISIPLTYGMGFFL